MVIGVVAFAIIFNTSLAKKLPLVEGIILLIHVVGVFALVIPLLVLAPRNDAKTALLHFNNGGEWPTMGIAFMVGLLTSLTSMLGFDCSVHMCKHLHFLPDKPEILTCPNSRRNQECLGDTSTSPTVWCRSQRHTRLHHGLDALLHSHRPAESA